VVEVCAALTTVFLVRALRSSERTTWHSSCRSICGLVHGPLCDLRRGHAEARGKAQADSLRKTKTDALANRVRENGSTEQVVFAVALRRCGDLQRGRTDPGDGDVIGGIAMVDDP